MSASAGRAVFLSYASQDAEAVRRLCEVLRAAGIEVWFDQNELVGGDAWDAKIRGQIARCAPFVPVISAATQARLEGYFRIEWKLAAQRTHAMAEEKAFVVPVVIDDTRDAEAKVPSEFRSVQWTRLPGGETPAAFGARIKALLGGETITGDGARLAGVSIVASAENLPKRRWLVPVLLGAGAVIAVGLWQPWKTPAAVVVASSPAGPVAVAPAKPAAPVSEARQLIAKAWVQLNKQELARAELETADALCKRAAELDPVDAEVWATWAQVHAWFTHHRLDRAESRIAAARDCSARAIRLDPGSFEARLAQAVYWTRGSGAGRTRETEQLLRELLRERPDDPRCLQIAGRYFMARKESHAEGLGMLERLAANPNYTALAWVEIGWTWHNRDNDMRRAFEAAEKSIAAKPFWHNLGLKAQIAAIWFGDLDLALATLRQIPQAELQEDWPVALRDLILTFRRKPKDRLSFLGGVPQEWLSSAQFTGPKAFLVGLARRDDGAEEVAKGDFRRALDLIEKNLGAQPNSTHLLALKAQCLKFMGEEIEAKKAYRVFRQLGKRSYLDPYLLFEPRDKVFELLEKEKWYAAGLRLSPYFDPLRDDPRFVALQAKSDADPMLSPHAPLAAGAGGERPAGK